MGVSVPLAITHRQSVLPRVVGQVRGDSDVLVTYIPLEEDALFTQLKEVKSIIEVQELIFSDSAGTW